MMILLHYFVYSKSFIDIFIIILYIFSSGRYSIIRVLNLQPREKPMTLDRT